MSNIEDRFSGDFDTALRSLTGIDRARFLAPRSIGLIMLTLPDININDIVTAREYAEEPSRFDLTREALGEFYWTNLLDLYSRAIEIFRKFTLSVDIDQMDI